MAKKTDPPLTKSEIARIRREAYVKKGYDFGITPDNLRAFRAGDHKWSVYTIEKTKPEPRQEVTAKLETKKLKSTSVATPSRIKTEAKKEEPKPKFTPKPLVKKLTSNAKLTGNLKTRVQNKIGEKQFKKEEKLSESYQRNKAGAPTSKDLKAEKKEVRKLGYGKAARDIGKAEKFARREEKGKNKYFTTRKK